MGQMWYILRDVATFCSGSGRSIQTLESTFAGVVSVDHRLVDRQGG